jgi:hypothetical protein
MFKRARHEFRWLECKKSMCAKFYPFSPVSQESFSLQVEWNSDCFCLLRRTKGGDLDPRQLRAAWPLSPATSLQPTQGLEPSRGISLSSGTVHK